VRILVLGAGAIGGFFGGRLAEGGADVTFLVRGRRKAQLDANGLVVKSALGDIALPVKTLAAGAVAPPFDIVLLSSKSYDLESAIAAIAPFMGPDSAVLPLLNGLMHLDRLGEVLGGSRVMGGTCFGSMVLDPDGTVRHIGTLQSLPFGELSGVESPRAKALAAEFAKTRIAATLSVTILQTMWEKLVMLATLAATTTLFRGTVGDIVAAPSGTAFMVRALEECAAVATAEGHAPSPAALGQFRGMLTAPGSNFAASTLRDLAAGRRTEGDHIIGDVVRRARRHAIAVPILETALTNIEVHEARLAAAS